MDYNPIIVVGASAGGVKALMDLVSRLPSDLAAVFCVVRHIGDRQSMLPELLGRCGPLPAAYAADREVLRTGRIYVAPPDHHLLIRPGHFHLSRGPRVNCTRPAVDPLFRSAAHVYGPAVIGLILSGMLNDGTAGFTVIKRHGGTTIVQDPDDARYAGMPLSALRHVRVDHCVRAREMPELLARLVKERAPVMAARTAARRTPTAAAEGKRAREGEDHPKNPAALTGPECGGTVTGSGEQPC